MFYCHNKKIELKVSVFFACLGSLFFCALLAMQLAQRAQLTQRAQGVQGAQTLLPAAGESAAVAGYAELYARQDNRGRDFILELYRQPASQDRVIDFFAEICPSREIAEIILSNASEFDVSPALAFALSWEESRFNSRAINRGNRDGSVDRGLFQLNNRSFPNIALQSFFNPRINAYYAMSHLRFCLDAGGADIAALAMYNAGTNRVRNTGAPMTTLNYAGRILENRRKIEARFIERENQYQAQLALLARTDGSARQGSLNSARISALKPLGIR